MVEFNNKKSNNTPTNNKKKSNNSKKSNNQGNNVKTEEIIIEEGSKFDIAYLLGKEFLTSQASRIILITMLVLILFLVLIYLLYHYTTGRKVQTLHNKVVALYNDTSITIPASNMKPSFTNKQTYIVYINFENSSGNHIWYHSFRDNKIILRRADDNFILKYNPHSNKLVVDIKIKRLDVQQVTLDEETGVKSIINAERKLGLHETYEHIYVPNIPHHQWLQIAVLIDNRLVDIYMNGKLAVSRVIQNVPIISNAAMLLGQEFHNPNAYVGRVEYANDVLSSLDLKSLYHKNMRFLKVDPVMRNIVVHQAYELQKPEAPATSKTK
jgi:hypothetical protein